MNSFAHQFVVGLTAGSIYASLAMALVIIHRATNQINFAQGEMAMFSTYLAWAQINAGVPYIFAFLSTIVLSFLIGMTIYRLIILSSVTTRPVSMTIVFIGLLVIFNAVAGWIFNHTVKSFPSPFPSAFTRGSSIASSHEIGSLIVTLTMIAIIYVFFRFTPLGLAMRAVAENRESSQLVGIRVSRMVAVGWGLAAAAGAVAGMMVAPIVFLDPHMMSGVLLYAIAGALLGGIDNPWGAAAGGVAVGLMESLLGAYVTGTELKLSVALAAIFVILLVRPNGIFGSTFVSRV